MRADAPLAAHKGRLAAFAAMHRALLDEGRENIDLKREHSLRVLDEALGILDSLGVDEAPEPDLRRAVELAALYHDMGRFPQYVRWRTFNDRVSENHGRLSVRAIRKAGVLAGLPDRQRKVVLSAVVLHNRRFLPPSLPPDVDFAARVVRDADKLDIYPVMLAHLEPGGIDNPVVTLGLDTDPEACTPAILEQISRRELCNYDDMRFVGDFKLLVLSWIYDLNFAHSRAALVRRGHLDRLLACLPRGDAFERLGAQVRADLGVGRG